MRPAVERVLEEWLAAGGRGMGQIRIAASPEGFLLQHREDEGRADLQIFGKPEDAIQLARFDGAGRYRPLKTAPNLRHGWRLDLPNLAAVRAALDFFYPGRLAALLHWETNRLKTTPLRQTLGRQTGMYRVTAKISDEQIDALVGRVCRSRGGEPGCLRTILWSRDETGARPSFRLPLEKYIAPGDQTGRGESVLPLLCQEACNLLVAEARKVVRGE
jgi:sirohydrochlorin cobaltochelatase